MTTRSALLLATGIVVGALAATFVVGTGGPQVQAQQPGVGPPVGRYQIASWGYGRTNGAGEHGAYVLDTRSGDVFKVTSADNITAVGSVEKPK